MQTKVRSSAEERFAKKLVGDPNSACILWTGPKNKEGYGRFVVDGRRMYAHRYAWFRVHGKIPVGLEIRHVVCDRPACVNIEHLAPGTHAENMADMVQHRRSAAGEKQRCAKLTVASVRLVFALRREGKTQQEIGDAVGLNQSSISRLLAMRTWRLASKGIAR